MLSLRQLRSKHPQLLIIDSASSLVHVGLLSTERPPVWSRLQEEAGVSIFFLVMDVCAASGVPIEAVDAMVFCEGPGSVLGIRTAAVALRTWNALRERPLYRYQSLHLVAAEQLQKGEAESFSVIADARRGSWHCLTVESGGNILPLRRAAPETLTGPVITPTEFRHWSELPGEVRFVAYDVETMLGQTESVPLFLEVTEPDAFLHEEPTYLTWTPHIHRAPT